jgi:hypothetical protein
MGSGSAPSTVLVLRTGLLMLSPNATGPSLLTAFCATSGMQWMLCCECLWRAACCVLGCCAGLPDTPATRLLEQRAVEFEGADIAASTRVEYQSWLRFCLVFGLSQYCFQPCERVVVWFAVWLSRSCNPRVVSTYLSGLCCHFQAAGLRTAAEWAGWLHLPRVLKGTKRVLGTPVSRKLAITPAMLAGMARVVPMTAEGMCLRCAMLLCFYAFPRKSHVCVQGSTLLVPHLLLQRQHVFIDPAAYAIIVTVHFSKTAQYNSGAHTIVIKGVKRGRAGPSVLAVQVFCHGACTCYRSLLCDPPPGVGGTAAAALCPLGRIPQAVAGCCWV